MNKKNLCHTRTRLLKHIFSPLTLMTPLTALPRIVFFCQSLGVQTSDTSDTTKSQQYAQGNIKMYLGLRARDIRFFQGV